MRLAITNGRALLRRATLALPKFIPAAPEITTEQFEATKGRSKLVGKIKGYNNSQFLQVGIPDDVDVPSNLMDKLRGGKPVTFTSTLGSAQDLARYGFNVVLIGARGKQPMWAAVRAKGVKISKAKKLLAYAFDNGTWSYKGDGENAESLARLMKSHVKAPNFIIVESPVSPDQARKTTGKSAKEIAQKLKGKIVKTVGKVP